MVFCLFNRTLIEIPLIHIVTDFVVVGFVIPECSCLIKNKFIDSYVSFTRSCTVFFLESVLRFKEIRPLLPKRTKIILYLELFRVTFIVF